MSVSQAIKLSIKAGLEAAELLPLARRFLAPLRTLQRTRAAKKRGRYYRQLVKLYASPLARPAESYAGFEKRESDRRVREVAARLTADRNAILRTAAAMFGNSGFAAPTSPASVSGRRHTSTIWYGLRALTGETAQHESSAVPAQRIDGVTTAPAGSVADREALIRVILDRVIDRALAPRFFDYDYLDDIVGIVGGRYCSETGCDFTAARAILDTLCFLAEPDGELQWRELPGALRRVLGESHEYTPQRGDVSPYVWDVIPDLAGEFLALKAENNVERFLEINREYSRRQAIQQGLWDNRELSLLRGYERDYHLMLRTLVQLIADGALARDDEVLLIGPRHVDEVVFFRRTLGLPRAVGLDLFPYGRNEILAGDMHRMPFESNRFKLVYCAGTLSYSYNARRVIEEIARVTCRPGFVFLADAAGRQAGPDALGRSDLVGIDTLVGMFHRHAFQVLARDAGRSLAPERYENEPCLALRLTESQTAWPSMSGAQSEQNLSA